MEVAFIHIRGLTKSPFIHNLLGEEKKIPQHIVFFLLTFLKCRIRLHLAFNTILTISVIQEVNDERRT